MLLQQTIKNALFQRGALVDQWFTARNATLGTGLAVASTATSVSDTAPMLVIDNTSAATDVISGDNKTVGQVEIVPVYIRMQNASVGANSTSYSVAGYLDTANRYSSGGVQLTSRNMHVSNVSGFNNRTSKAKVYFGAILATANTAATECGRAQLKVAASPGVTLGDTFTLAFGGEFRGSGGVLYPTTVPFNEVIVMPPVRVGIGCSYQLYPFAPSNTTGMTWEIEVGWLEVPV